MPSNRTVVFRGFAPEDPHASLLIVTDARSDKMAHFGANPHAEVCWYRLRTEWDVSLLIM